MESTKSIREKESQSISAFDFSNFYTNMNHDKLKFVLGNYPTSALRKKCPYSELFWSVFSPNAGKCRPEQLRILILFTQCCFKGGSENYIAVTNFGARSVVDKKNCQVVFDKAKLKLATTYLLDNRCFTVWNSTFREMIGIPMGLDPVPFMANLFLHSFNLHKTRGLTNTFGFIDDMRSINENGFQTF